MKLCGKGTLSAHNLARLERKYAFFKIYRGKKFGRKTYERKRKIRFSVGIYFSFGRVRHRYRQCVEIPVHYRHIRRRSIHPDVSCVPCGAGSAHYGVRIHRGPRQPHGHGQSARYTGTEGHEMASHEVDQHSRQLFADDVLHHGGRLDAEIRIYGGNRYVCRLGRQGGRGRVRRYADKSGHADVLGDCRHCYFVRCMRLWPGKGH